MPVLTPLYLTFVFLLAIAGVSKLRAPDAAVLAARAAGLSASRNIIRAVAGAEILLAAAAVGASARYVSIGVALLYAGFAVMTLRLVRRGVSVSCGCFGGAETPATWLHVAVCTAGAALAGVEAAAGPRLSLWHLLVNLPSDGIAVAACAVGAAAITPAVLAAAPQIVTQFNRAHPERPTRGGAS